MSETALNRKILTSNLRRHLTGVINTQLDMGYVSKDGSTVTGRNLNEIVADMRDAGYSMPGTTASAMAYFEDLGFKIALGFRREGSGARYGDVVVPGSVEVANTAPVTLPEFTAPDQVWERQAA